VWRGPPAREIPEDQIILPSRQLGQKFLNLFAGAAPSATLALRPRPARHYHRRNPASRTEVPFDFGPHWRSPFH
jgi:hypothetical protein